MHVHFPITATAIKQPLNESIFIDLVKDNTDEWIGTVTIDTTQVVKIWRKLTTRFQLFISDGTFDADKKKVENEFKEWKILYVSYSKSNTGVMQTFYKLQDIDHGTISSEGEHIS